MTIALVEREQSLDELAEIANFQHGQVVAALKSGVEHAIAAGEALYAVRARTPHGQWLPWLATNFVASEPTAYGYIRLAMNKEIIRELGFTSAKMALTHCFRSNLLGAGTSGGPRISEVNARGAEMRKLRKQGMSAKEIAELYGVGVNVVYTETSQGARARKVAAQRRGLAKRNAERAAWKREQRDKQMRSAGGPTAEAYSVIRRTLVPLLEAAIGAASNNESKAELNSALQRLYAVEDHIVRASKVAS